MPAAAGTTLPREVAVQGEDAAQAGAVLHERLELRELHLVAGDVRADGAAAEVVQRMLVIRVRVDAGRAGDQRERGTSMACGVMTARAVRLSKCSPSMRPVDDGDVGRAGRAADGAGEVRVER